MYAKRNIPTVLKDIALFLLAPVIALSYLVLFPYFAIRMAWQAIRQKQTAKDVD